MGKQITRTHSVVLCCWILSEILTVNNSRITHANFHSVQADTDMFLLCCIEIWILYFFVAKYSCFSLRYATSSPCTRTQWEPEPTMVEIARGLGLTAKQEAVKGRLRTDKAGFFVCSGLQNVDVYCNWKYLQIWICSGSLLCHTLMELSAIIHYLQVWLSTPVAQLYHSVNPKAQLDKVRTPQCTSSNRLENLGNSKYNK